MAPRWGLPTKRPAALSIRIAAVRLYPVPCLGGNQTGGDYLTRNSQLRQLPIQHIPRRSRLITGPQLLYRAQFMDQFANRFQPVGNRAKRTNFAFQLRHRDGYCFGMDIQTYTLYFRHSDQLLSYAALRRWIFPIRSVTRAYYESGVGRSIMTSFQEAAKQATLDSPVRS